MCFEKRRHLAMSIIPSHVLRANESLRAAPRAHDPLICGIDPATDCDACRHARFEREFLERDLLAKAKTRRRNIALRFTETTGLSVAELAEALLPELAVGVAEITAAVLDERGPRHGRA